MSPGPHRLHDCIVHVHSIADNLPKLIDHRAGFVNAKRTVAHGDGLRDVEACVPSWTTCMSTAQLELGVPTEPAPLVEAEKRLAVECTQPLYTTELDERARLLVQQRCEAAATRCEVPHADLVPTIAATWMEYASGTYMNIPEGCAEQRKMIAEMAPPAFRMDKCVVKLT